jgi:glucuronosyltransferase
LEFFLASNGNIFESTQQFIHNGGSLSAFEVLNDGVPLIGILIFGDQKMNVHMAARKGYGLVLQFDNISEASVTVKISQKAKDYSQIYSDLPTTLSETVVYWTKYVIRHEGAQHL